MADTSGDNRSASPFVELANRNLYTPWGLDRLEFLPQLRGRRGSEIYREMAHNDALIGAILYAIEMILRQVEWEVEPTGSGEGEEISDQDLERADFLASCLDDLSQSWEEVIKNALTMLPFGFAYLEIVYKRRESADITAPAEARTKFPDGKIGWRKFTLVPHETITEFDTDDTGGVQSAVQGGVYGEKTVTIPIEKALLFRTDSRSPRGVSVLRNCVESWYYRKRIREIEGIGMERDLAGFPVFYLDADICADAGKMAEYERMISNIRRDEQEGVVLPAVMDDKGVLQPVARLELLSSGGARQFDTDKVIARYAREIAMSLLQDVVLLGHEKVGTQALASEKRDLSDTTLQAWLNDLASVFNQHAIPRLFALNGESLENLPKLCPGELRATDVLEFSEALKNIAGAGFTLADDPEVENEVRRRLGFNPLLPEVQQRMQEDLIDPPEPPVSPMPPTDGPPPQEQPPNGQQQA